jgi:two-component system, NarL family, sensor histidine kinase UhpB
VSLRVRLILVITLMFLLGTLVVLGRSIAGARQEISKEIDFSRQVITQFINLLASAEPAGVEDDEQQYLRALRSQLARLETAGKFEINVYPVGYIMDGLNVLDTDKLEAPQWFLKLLGLQDGMLLLQHEITSGEFLLIRIDPVAEINTIWEEVGYYISTRFGSMLTVAMVLYLLVGYWMKPISGIIAALDQLESGNFNKRIPLISLLEINEIAQKINHLAAVLGASKADNERLTRHAMTVQEQERRFLAQELHDSLGQAVSAIKAMAVSIANRTRGQLPAISESALNIEKISDDAYSSVRNLMAWLRPAVLDEMGLTLALQQMVDDWNMHHEDTFCSLRLEADFSGLKDQQQIQVYRIVQEALTNIAKHADADRVSIVASGDETITLVISDDGKGFNESSVKMGIGLTNIRDRANLLRGTLAVSSELGQGTTLEIKFPRGSKFRRHHEHRE